MKDLGSRVLGFYVMGIGFRVLGFRSGNYI